MLCMHVAQQGSIIILCKAARQIQHTTWSICVDMKATQAYDTEAYTLQRMIRFCTWSFVSTLVYSFPTIKLS